MANSPEVGGNGGGRPAESLETRIGAPEKARFPSDPVYEKSPASSPAADASFPTAANLRDTARTATDALKAQAAQFAEDVGHELGRTGESQKMRGVDALHRVARAIGGAADDLEGQSPSVARTVREAARQVDGLSDALANRNVNDLIDQAAALARARPALFVGGSVVAGFALARFLMSGGASRAAARPKAEPL